MSNTKQKISNMIGMKVFREREDGSLEIYRIKGFGASSKSVICFDTSDNLVYLNVKMLENFKVLSPDGMFMISTVRVDNGQEHTDDVIVSISKYLEIKAGIIQPYGICRQSITDVFYNLLCNDESEQIAGLAINRDNCPANFDMGIMMACSKVKRTQVVYFYREDMIEDILKFITIREYDMVLTSLYNKHAKTCGDPSALLKREHKGWCKNLRTLLKENAFQTDIDNMLGITEVSFDFSKYIFETSLPDESKGGYYTVDDDMKLWLSGTFRIAIDDITVLEYEHDINLADLNNTRYFILRDKCKKLYICVYTINGEYLESDLQDAYEKKSFIDEWRLEFVDKYRKSRNLDENGNEMGNID